MSGCASANFGSRAFFAKAVSRELMTTLLLMHPACLDHVTPAGHPERPDRLRAIERALDHEKFQALIRGEAPRADIDAIARVHPRDYITAIEDATPSQGLARLDA